MSSVAPGSLPGHHSSVRHIGLFVLRSLGLAVVLTVAACASRDRMSRNDGSAEDDTAAAQPRETSPPLSCAVAEGTLTGKVRAVDWIGEYDVVLLSSTGTRTEGTLTLRAQAEELQTLIGPGGEPAPNTRIPLYGWIDIDESAVGAVVPGDPRSQNPEAPGVAVLESRMGDQAPNILLRLGSEANRRGQVRFDGAFTVLRVTESDPGGFRGRWSSGVRTDRSEGVFCAYAR